jgi:hypothetical protein
VPAHNLPEPAPGRRPRPRPRPAWTSSRAPRPPSALALRVVPVALAVVLAAAVLSVGLATGAQTPPWRTPEWTGGAQAPEPAAPEPTAPEPAAPEPAAPEPAAPEPAAPERPERLLGRDVAFLGQQALTPAGAPAAGPLCPGCLALRRDGARIVLADNAAETPAVRVYAPYPGGELRERGYLLGHLTPIAALLVTDDFRILASAAGAEGADAERTLRLWNAEALNQRTPGLRLPHARPTALAAPPDGRWFAVGDAGGHVRVFRDRHGRQGGRALRAFEGTPVGALAAAPDGARLFVGGAAAGAPVRVVSVGPDGPALDRSGPPLTAAAPVTALLVGPAPGGGAALFVGDAEGGVSARALPDGRPLWTARADGAVRRLRVVASVDAGGDVLLVAAAEGPDLLALDPPTGRTAESFRARHRAAGLLDASFDPETGLIVLAHADGTIEVWRRAGAPAGDRWR